MNRMRRILTGLALAATVLTTSGAAHGEGVVAPEAGQVVRLSTGGAPVGVLKGDRLFALLIDEEKAAEWVVVPDGDHVRFAVRGTNNVITAPNEEARTQAVVRPDATDKSLWQIRELGEDGGEGAPVTKLESGYYTIEQDGNVLGRSRVEDYSLLPKRVYSRTDNPRATWTIEVTG